MVAKYGNICYPKQCWMAAGGNFLLTAIEMFKVENRWLYCSPQTWTKVVMMVMMKWRQVVDWTEGNNSWTSSLDSVWLFWFCWYTCITNWHEFQLEIGFGHMKMILIQTNPTLLLCCLPHCHTLVCLHLHFVAFPPGKCPQTWQCHAVH